MAGRGHRGASARGGGPPGSGTTVLGIDPGLTRCGFAVVAGWGSRPVAVAIGVVTSPPTMDVPARLAMVQSDVEALIEEYSPSALAIEQVFQRDNIRSAMAVAQASGAIMAAAVRKGMAVHIYTPTQVKSAVAGHGSADKAQVGRMVKMRLALDAVPSPPDAADAAAIALCHLACAPLSSALANNARGAFQ